MPTPAEASRAALTDLEPARLLGRARAAVRAAGREIERVRAGGWTVRHKADASPVTEADLAADAALRAALADTGIAMLSEEVAPGELAAWDALPGYWLADPLDGTKGFVAGSDEFTVNLALVVGGYPVLGVIEAPALGMAWWGGQNLGAWRQEAGDEMTVSIEARLPPVRPRALVSRSHRDPATDAWLAARGPLDTTDRGSSLKFCELAEGRADLYPRLHPGGMSLWDVAAGQAVLEGAGGRVTRLADSQRLDFRPGRGLAISPFLATGRPDPG